MKICFAASSGGHLQQLMMLEPIMKRYESFIITEKTDYKTNLKGQTVHYVSQIQRKEKKSLFSFLGIFGRSISIFFKEKPDVIVSTGVLATIPISLLGKIFNKRVIYIESYAKSKTLTLTGKMMNLIADDFYVQWDSLQKIYDNAIYMGSIY